MMTALNILLWVVLGILALLGGILALVLLIVILLLVLPIGVRLNNGYEKMHVWLKIWFLKIKLSPGKELTEEEKAAKKAKKEAKAAKKKAKKEKKKQKAEEKARRKAEKAKNKPPKPKTKKKKKKSKKLPKPPKEKDTLGMVRALWASLRDYDYPYAKLFCVRDLTLVATIGGDGPAETGRNYGKAAEYFGILYPYVTRIFHIKRHRIHVNPDFAHKKTQIKFDLTVTITLYKFLRAALAFWRSFKRNKLIYCKPQPKTEELTVSGRSESESEPKAETPAQLPPA